MSTQHLIIFPKDWHYRPSLDLITNVVHFMQREGLMGGPLPLTPQVSSVFWRLGMRLGQLGVRYREGFGDIAVKATDTLMVHYAFDGAAYCPTCSQKVDEAAWGDLMDQLYQQQADPSYACTCGADSTLLSLKHSPPLGAGYFAIELTDCGPEDDMMERPVWKELERVIGTELAWTVYRT